MLYGAIEGNIKLTTNEDSDCIRIVSERDNKTIIDLYLEDDVYDTKELAQELLGMAMKIICDLDDEEAMISAIQSELTDNYDTSKKEYAVTTDSEVLKLRIENAELHSCLQDYAEDGIGG